MIVRTSILAVFCFTLTTAVKANAQDFESQLDEIASYSNSVSMLCKENEVSGVKLAYVIQDRNEAIQNFLDGAYYWHNQGYTEYAKTKMFGVRKQASDMRDAAFDLYYESPQDQYVAYYSWIYAQSMMIVANEVLNTL